MCAAGEEPRVKQRGDVIGADRAVADAAFRRFDFDQRLQPKEPARAGADDLDVEFRARASRAIA